MNKNDNEQKQDTENLNSKQEVKKLKQQKTLEQQYYELQKAHAGVTETVKLSFYHLPWRLFLAFMFIFDIITDFLVILELYDNNIKGNKTAALIIFIVSFVFMIGLNCRNMKAEKYPANGCLRLVFALFGVFGLDSIVYFVYSAITLEGHTFYDYKINGPRSPRKLWGAWQSVLSSFITAHYIFYYADSSVLAVLSLFSSMINARLNMNMTHTRETFKKMLVKDIFCMRFFSTFFEIIGRPLFYAATTIIIIDESSFLSDDRKPFHLTYEFFAWDGILLGITCFILGICYQLYFKNIKISLSLMIQNFIGGMLIRPAVDKNDLKKAITSQKMAIYIDDQKTTNQKHLKRQIQLGLGFPVVWRLLEYIVLNIIIYDEKYLDLAEKKDDSILYLAYLTLITNGINTVVLIFLLFVLFTYQPQFDSHVPEGPITKKQIGISGNIEHEVKLDPSKQSVPLQNDSGSGRIDS